jgi:FKBP-type peptidyl-prolyl cis-trans isomerase SlyD
MTVQPNTIVELSYTLRNSDQHVIEHMSEQWPLKFYCGSGAMLPGFEANLEGLTEGSRFEFTLSAKEAYGTINPEYIQEIPINQLPDSEDFPNRVFERGDQLQFSDEDGVRVGRIVEVLENAIVVDFNHSLAGADLHFTGRVLQVRKPRPDEAVEKRYIEPNGIRSDSRLK